MVYVNIWFQLDRDFLANILKHLVQLATFEMCYIAAVQQFSSKGSFDLNEKKDDVCKARHKMNIWGIFLNVGC